MEKHVNTNRYHICRSCGILLTRSVEIRVNIRLTVKVFAAYNGDGEVDSHTQMIRRENWADISDSSYAK